jgi:hypothetical protein
LASFKPATVYTIVSCIRRQYQVKLTVNAIKSLNSAIKEVEHMDTDYPGFGVRVNPGGSKTFIYRYRINGKLKRISLGRLLIMAAEVCEFCKRLGRLNLRTFSKAL